MTPHAADEQDTTTASEWREGWRIVLACALGSGTGVVLLFFSFSLFLIPVMTELQMTRGQFGTIQSLVIAGALGAPAIGWLTDRLGFRIVFVATSGIVVALELLMAAVADSMASMAVCIFLLAFFGVGTSALTATRPISAHFHRHRGKALGLVVAGLSLATILVPAPLQAISELYGWRWAIVALSGLLVLIGVPAVLFILPRSHGAAPPPQLVAATASYPYFRDPAFWYLTLGGVFVAAATSGFIGQLSPMIQEEGVSATTAAVALSLFATGQLLGRIGGGFLLDRFAPRWVAMLATLIPGTGFLLLYFSSGSAVSALLAAGMIGLLAGLELDVGAYFVSRLFPVSQYSSIYGAMQGIGWIGTAIGLIGVGLLHDRLDSYAPAQLIAAALLVVGALLFAQIRSLTGGLTAPVAAPVAQ